MSRIHVHNRWHHIGSPDGWAFLVTSAVRALARRAEWGDTYIPHYRGIRNTYIHVFSQRELLDLLTGAEFEVVELVVLNEARNTPSTPAEPSPSALTATSCSPAALHRITLPSRCGMARSQAVPSLEDYLRSS
jgi:hypothetical protein